ncbi:MAG: GNAT family N-acetyltransferase [Oscillospiraceae bacterium]|nr:GNAT family N-acetyltransferase [Oscillospiraceae bacterium]
MITYQTTKEFTAHALQSLFLSVAWASGKSPDKLVAAMRNYGSVFSAWDGDRLVGMICTMDDGVMTAYVHYLLVDPAYQKQGIGRQLIEQMREHYANYTRIVLGAYNTQVGFYETCGFKRYDEASFMAITDMED